MGFSGNTEADKNYTVTDFTYNFTDSLFNISTDFSKTHHDGASASSTKTGFSGNTKADKNYTVTDFTYNFTTSSPNSELTSPLSQISYIY
jgi:hypothetical protein